MTFLSKLANFTDRILGSFFNFIVSQLRQFVEGITGQEISLKVANLFLLFTLFLAAFFIVILLFIAELVRIRRRKRLEMQKSEIEAVFNSLMDGLVIWDKSGRINLVNIRAEIILGIRASKIIGKKIGRVPSASLKKIYSLVAKDLTQTSIITKEISIDKPFKRFLQVKVLPFLRAGLIEGRVLILEDISREKGIERMKSDFITITAHQLRTPLSAIKWILNMVIDGDLGRVPAQQSEILAKAYKSNERMIGLINDLLRVARIEEGRFGYKFLPHHLEKITQEVIQNFTLLIKERNIKLTYHRPSQEFPPVRLDESKIKIAISNLIDNAIKYTQKGGQVDIFLEKLGRDLRFKIKDTGVGISEYQISRLFTKFFRGDNVVKMQTDGTGLGLFIVKNIIEKHGGKIWLESEEQKGSTFYFTIPIKI